MHLYMHPSVDIISRGSLTQGKVSLLLVCESASHRIVDLISQRRSSPTQYFLTMLYLMMHSHYLILTYLTQQVTVASISH